MPGTDAGYYYQVTSRECNHVLICLGGFLRVNPLGSSPAGICSGFAHLDAGKACSSAHLPPLPFALPTTSIFHNTWSRPPGKLLAPPCPTAQEGGGKMEGGHRPEGQKCPQLRVLFSFLQAWYTFAVYL